MSRPKYKAIHLTVVELFQSETKWWIHDVASIAAVNMASHKVEITPQIIISEGTPEDVANIQLI